MAEGSVVLPPGRRQSCRSHERTSREFAYVETGDSTLNVGQTPWQSRTGPNSAAKSPGWLYKEAPVTSRRLGSLCFSRSGFVPIAPVSSVPGLARFPY